MFRTISLEPTAIIPAIMTLLTLLTITTLILRAILTTFHYKTTFFHLLDTRFILWTFTTLILLLDISNTNLAIFLSITTTVYLLAYETVLKLDISTAILALIYDCVFTTGSFLLIEYFVL